MTVEHLLWFINDGGWNNLCKASLNGLGGEGGTVLGKKKKKIYRCEARKG